MSAEAETPILWPPDANWLLRKDPDAGKDWRQEEKGTTEDETLGWHHRLNGHESEWTPGVGDGQGGLASCSAWGCKESDTTEWLKGNWYRQWNFRTKILTHSTTWISLGDNVSSKISQWQGDKYWKIPLTEIPRVKSTETESIMVVARGWGEGRNETLVFNGYSFSSGRWNDMKMDGCDRCKNSALGGSQWFAA